MARHLLTDFELMILLAVLRVGDHAYGVPVAAEIERIGGRTVARAAVYAALDRLEQRGLVSSRQGEPTAERGGRAKRFFAVTPKGVRSVRDTQRALTALWHGVPALQGGDAS
jgi:PadR family transcriptional regulator, regulatory protein PadR